MLREATKRKINTTLLRISRSASTKVLCDARMFNAQFVQLFARNTALRKRYCNEAKLNHQARCYTALSSLSVQHIDAVFDN